MERFHSRLLSFSCSPRKPFTNIGDGLAHPERDNGGDMVRRQIQVGHADALPLDQLAQQVIVIHVELEATC